MTQDEYKNLFKTQMFAIATGWQIEPPTKDFMAVNFKVMTDAGVQPQDFMKACGHILSNYRGFDKSKLPSASDFIAHSGVKTCPEQLANDQWHLIVLNKHKIKWEYKVIFSDPITNWVIEKRLGGLTHFREMWLHKDNPKYKPEHFLERDFIDAYLYAYDAGHKHEDVVEAFQIPAPFKKDVPLMIGDKVKTTLMIENAQKDRDTYSEARDKIKGYLPTFNGLNK